MGKTLIVCEKPSAAVKIASALAARRPRKGDFNGVPYYEFKRGGGRVIVVPALGCHNNPSAFHFAPRERQTVEA